jgi:hypothetical protein
VDSDGGTPADIDLVFAYFRRMNWYSVGADAVLVLHFGYIAFTVGGAAAIAVGGPLGWRWVRQPVFRLIHFVAVAVVAVEAMLGVLCPLTKWEYTLRRRAGQTGTEETSLVVRIVHQLIFYDFPDWVFIVLYIGFAALVMALFFIVPVRRVR